MKKGKKSVAGNLIVGGASLSIGSSTIEALPASAAKSHVQAGLVTGSKFFPVMGTIGGAGLTLKQLKKLK